MFCNYCRAENPRDARFCSSCGQEIRGSHVSSGVRTPPTPAWGDSLNARMTAARPPAAALTDSLDARVTGSEPRDALDDGFPAGHRFAGRWRVESRLGRGGMGEVYRVHDELLAIQKALKVVHPALVRSPEAQKRFLEEAALTQTLRHDGIVQTYEVATDGDQHLYTMEFVDGGSLRGWIESRKAAGVSGAVTDVAAIVDAILAALAYAHARNVVHRDIKPENVLLTRDGHVKVADFGLAKLVDPARLASMSQVMGTPYYMAPEQLTAKAPVDPRADLYAVGVIVYELLTGEVPLGRFDSVSTLRRDSSPGLDAVLDKALARRAEDRIASATEFRSALGALSSSGWRAVGLSTAGGSLAAERPVAHQGGAAGSLEPAAAGGASAAQPVAASGERFTVVGDGTIVDNRTGLMWAAADNGTGIDWRGAKRYAETSKLGGHEGWRLPTQTELLTLYDESVELAKNEGGWDTRTPRGFQFTGPWFWASETRAAEAACVYFSTGARHFTGRYYSEAGRVLPVRLHVGSSHTDSASGRSAGVRPPPEPAPRLGRGRAPTPQPEAADRPAEEIGSNMADPPLPDERFTVVGDGTIIDNRTGLMWAQRDNGSDIDFPGAERYAARLTLGGHRNWRLPSRDELLALYDESLKLERNEGGRKTRTPPGFRFTGWWYWTEDPRHSEAGFAGFVNFGFGGRNFHLLGLSIAFGGRVLPVRVHK